MSCCKHQNGELQEWVQAAHIRDVVDGVLDTIGENMLDHISHYVYVCADCGREWRYSSPMTLRLKWLRRIHKQLKSEW